MAQDDNGPPAGMFPDDAPAPSQDDRGGQGGGGKAKRKPPQFDVATEMRAFYATIDNAKTQAEIKAVLPDHIDITMYVRVAKTAATSNPDLLNPEWRGSLMRAIARAAGQGLLPDGKEGALIARWDEQAHAYGVCWQPMVWGITKLGRLTGQIKKIYANLAFDGEEFQPLGGEDEGRIIHRISPKIVDEAYALAHDPNKFWDRVTAAYCIITTSEGEKVTRWMPRSRIMRVRATSKAAKGPWNGPFSDEMGLKTVILWTVKWLDLNINNPATARFREALETDMEADFDHAGNLIEHDGAQVAAGAQAQRALPAPGPKLDNIMDQLNRAKEAEKVEAGAARQDAQQQRQPAQDAQQDNRPPATGGGQGAEGRAAPIAGDQQASVTAAAPGDGTNDAPAPAAERRSPPPAQGRPAAPATTRSTAEAAARAFLAEMKQEIAMVASLGSLNALFAQPGVKRRSDRLMESFPDLHKELTATRSAKEQEFGPPDASNDEASAGEAA